MNLSIFSQWLKVGPETTQVVCFAPNGSILGSDFIGQVQHCYQQLIGTNQLKWLLASEDSTQFAVGLCALLLAGKEAILPPNTQPGTLSALQDHFDASLTDMLPISDKPAITFSEAIRHTSDAWPITSKLGRIKLYTSGSSGEAKCVSKTLTQLDAEVSILEQTFASSLQDCTIAATVSHQHIYGLLFKIIWPLTTGRTFLSPQIAYPETLVGYLEQHANLALVSSPAHLTRLPESLRDQNISHNPQVIFSSGGPLHTNAAVAINHCFDLYPIEIFGSTETGGIAYRQQFIEQQPWQAFNGIEINVAPKSDALMLKSPYLENDQWLTTQDKIKLECTTSSSQQFQLLGRLDRITKIEEKRISLPQMEACLTTHPYVSQAAIVILVQPKRQLAAVIELSTKGRQLQQEKGKLYINNILKAHLLNDFEPVTLPKRWRYPEQLPQNSQGKRVQAQLTELFTQ